MTSNIDEIRFNEWFHMKKKNIAIRVIFVPPLIMPLLRSWRIYSIITQNNYMQKKKFIKIINTTIVI